MRYDNDEFSTINQGRIKRPFFVVEIEFASGDLVHFTSHTDALTPSGAVVHSGVVKNLSGTSQSINPQKANATIGAISFEMVDLAGDITTLFRTKLSNDKGLRHKRCRFYMGFDELTTFDDYTLLQTQLIEQVVNDSGSYKIQCMDVQRQMREDIFEPKKTALSATLEEDATAATVYRTEGFERVDHGPSYSDAPNIKVGYLRIGTSDDFEIVRYTATTATEFSNLTRGVLGTRKKRWELKGSNEENGVQVTEFIYLEMPAVKLAYALLTGNLNQQAGETLPDHWHLGIDASYVRLTDFTLVGSDWYDQSDDEKGRQVRFEGLEKTDGKQFIEEQIYLFLGAFSPVHSDGALGLKRMTGVLSGASYVANLNETNITSYSALKHDMKSVANRILIEWNWNHQRRAYTRKNALLDQNSIDVHGNAPLKRLKFRGLHGSAHSYDALKTHFDAYRDRFAGPPVRLSVSVLPSGNTIEVGDIVKADLTQLRDFSGTSTLNRSFEVQRASVDWVRGRVDLNLFGSTLDASPLPPEPGLLPDSYYISEGTNIETAFPSQTSESGGIVTITADINLAGGSSINGASAIYYVDGDCIIDAGVRVTYNNNVQLRVKGTLTCNGELYGKGKGYAGGSYPSDFGTTGYIGPALFSQQGTRVSDTSGFIEARYAEYQKTTEAANHGVPSLNLHSKNSAVQGFPDDLRGSAGSFGGTSHDSDWNPQATGGDGGAGGAGLAIVCRGMAMGGSALIDCSGVDGSAGSSWLYSGLTLWSGGGAGGSPGAVVIALDGYTANMPDMVGHVNAAVGDTITSGDAVASIRYSSPSQYPSGISAEIDHFIRDDKSGFDMTLSDNGVAVRSFFITPEATLNPDVTGTADDVLSLSLVEQINTPPTPAANLSTVVVTVDPPSDTNYSHAHIEYRLQGDIGWFEVGPAEPQAFVVLSSDGNTYEFRARSVSKSGELSPSGPTQIIELSHVDGAIDDTDYLSALNITGLELFEQGNDTDFTGKDAKFVWRKSSLSSWVDPGSETPAQGLGQGATDLHFLDYEVKIYDGSTLRRTEHVVDPMYVYTFEKNLEDSIQLGDTTALRQFTINVVQRTRQNKTSRTPAELTVQNPAPEIPAIQTAPGYNFFNATYNKPTDPDWIGIRVYMSASSGFTLNESTLVVDGPDTTIMVGDLNAGQTYYYQYVPYDAFGPGDASGEQTFNTGALTSADMDDTPPTDPSNLVLTTGVEDNGLYTKAFISATWDASTDDGILTGYFVEHWDDVDSTKIQTFSNVESFRITDAVPGRTYSVRVQAVDWASNLSGWTATETQLADGDTTAPANVTGLTATAGLDKVILAYTNPGDTDFAAVKVYRGTSSGFTPSGGNLITTFPGGAGTDSEIIDANVTNGTAYYYKTKTIDVSGNESDESAAVGPVTPFKITDSTVGDFFENASITNAIIEALDASKITTGYLAAARLLAGTITADKLNVTTLSSITANLGTITAGLIEGLIIRTANATAKVQMDTGGLYGENASGDRTFLIAVDGSGFLGSSGAISWDTSGNVTVPGSLIAGEMVGKTIKTALSGWRVELNASGLKYWNGTTTNFNLDASGNLSLTGDIELNKPSYASTTAGIWMGDDSGTYKFHIGDSSNYLKWSGSSLIMQLDAIGSGASVGSNSIAFGSSADASATYSVAIGKLADASATSSVAIGYNALATSSFSVAIGYGASVGATTNTAIGYGAAATSADTVAIGNQATCSGSGASAFGSGAIARKNYCTSIGAEAESGTTGGNSEGTAIGYNATATGQASCSIGQNTTATASQSTALGQHADATGVNSNALGHASAAAYTRAIAIGNGVSSSAANEIALGGSSDDVYIAGTLDVNGTKNFKIPHPTKPDHWLRHSVVESDVGGANVYRRSVTTIGNTAVLEMPDWFAPLNKDIDIFIQADKHFGRAFAEVSGNQITITSDQDGEYKLLIVGTRQDGATDGFEVESPMHDSQIFERDFVQPERVKIGRPLKLDERFALWIQHEQQKRRRPGNAKQN
jgi:hypothetical protein